MAKAPPTSVGGEMYTGSHRRAFGRGPGRPAIVPARPGVVGRGLLLLLVPLSVLSQSTTIATIGGRPINIGVDTIVIAVVLAWTISQVPASVEVAEREPAARALLAWMAWNAVTFVIGAFNATARPMVEGGAVLLRQLQYVPIFLLLAQGMLPKRAVRNAFLLLIAAGLLGSGIAIWQVAHGLDRSLYKGAPSFTVPLFRELDRAELTDARGLYRGSANYNVAGTYFAMALIMLLGGWHLPVFRSSSVHWLSAVVLTTGTALSASKSAMASTLVGVVVLGGQRSWRRGIGVLVIALLVSAGGLALLRDTGLVQEVRETARRLPEAVGLVLRGERWDGSQNIGASVFGAAMRVVGAIDAVRVAADHPVLGLGYGMYSGGSELFTPDNFFLQSLAETGLIGVVICMIVLSRLFEVGSRLKKSTDVERIRLGRMLKALLWLLIVANVSSGLFYSQKIWGPFLIVCGLCLGEARRDKELARALKAVSGSPEGSAMERTPTKSGGSPQARRRAG